MKYIVDKINSRLDIAEVISKYEDSIKLSKWNKGKIKKGSMFELWDNFKWPNMHATWVLKEEKIREQKKKKLLEELIVKNFTTLMKNIMQKSSMNPKYKKHEEKSYTKAHHNQIAQN